ncbi:MAG: hypothetical protein CFE44_13355 [Burkholderiales bacterium PBB4]|nr:MAG: hypothetical protein CFE44_13355 [Burkholderiales bacterium PBB4]
MNSAKTLVNSLWLCAALLGVRLVAHADYRDSTYTKLEAARKYADDFLKEDARPGKQFSTRTPNFPVWKDQPVRDCGVSAIMRAIQTQEPYFEDKAKKVVIVPVWVELLMLVVDDDSGFPYNSDGEGFANCKFEYEQYSFVTQRFEKLPEFLGQPHSETFK